MICTKCFYDLLDEAFYKSPAKVCKECHKAQMRGHYQTPGYRKKIAEYQRDRLKVPENHAKHQARMAVRMALRSGELVKGTNCALCNTDKDIEAHHKDYSELLEVIWLCRNCHASYHAAEAIRQAQVKARGMSMPGSTDTSNHSIHYAILTKPLI